nr:hypothetical protein [Tanacetum cinerariifolium]
DDDARPEGESNAKRKRTSEKGIDYDEVAFEEVILEFLAESYILTFDNKKRMQDALDDIMRSRCDPGEYHAYHPDQMKRYVENQIV